jgi:hypothetical protein
MTHPSDATLALYAGDDLGWIARRRAGHHLVRCERCRREVGAYRSLRVKMPDLEEMPGLSWGRLAGEMRANIRLGLAAGECVGTPRERLSPAPRSWFGTRALVSYASIAALVAASVLLERPSPRNAAPAEGIVLAATQNGIEVKEGGQAMSLLHARAGDVIYSVEAQGSIRARYVDSETEYVTINNVYAQ